VGSGISFVMNVFGLLLLTAVFCAVVWSLVEPLRRAVSPRWDVFVSYRSTDRRVIMPFVSLIKRCGFTVWFDQTQIDVEASRRGRFSLPISRGLQRSRVAVIFTSADYCTSQYCRQEAQFIVSRLADNGASRIIEVRLDGYPSRNLLRLPRESPLIDAAGSGAGALPLIKSIGDDLMRAIRNGLESAKSGRGRRI
jgi:hypothetical protein